MIFQHQDNIQIGTLPSPDTCKVGEVYRFIIEDHRLIHPVTVEFHRVQEGWMFTGGLYIPGLPRGSVLKRDVFGKTGGS